MATDTPQPLSFSDFLEKMKDPAAADLVRNIKSFIKQFEDRAKSHQVNPEVDSAKVQEFMAKSEDLFRNHPVWRGSLPAVLDQAVEGLEKYVMSKIWRQTFAVSQEDRDRDERYSRLMRALGFVDLPTLMGVEGVQPDVSLLAMAQGELLKMDKYKAPRDKLLCLVNVKTMVENIVNEAAKKGAKIGGADAFFPVFLFIVIRSCLPRLASNVEHIKRFRMASRLTGQFDYMLCNLESAAMYLDTVDYQHLRISQDDFLARLSAAGIPEADVELRRLQQQRQQQQQLLEQYGEGVGKGGLSSPTALSSPRALESYLRQQQPEQHQVPGSEDGGPLPETTTVAAAQSDGDGQSGGAPSSSIAEVNGVGGAGDGQLQQASSAGLVLQRESASAAVGGDDAAAISTPSRSPHQAPPASSFSPSGRGPEGVEVTIAASPGMLSGEGGLSPLHHTTPSGGAALGFEGMASELSASETLQRQLLDEAGLRLTSGAAAPAETATELSFVEDMVAEGTQYVIEAEARGQLQHKYPYMYASPADLTVADVRRVLAGYKRLVLRYEALALSLRRQVSGAPAQREQRGASSLSTMTPPLSATSLEALATEPSLQRPAGGSHESVPAAPGDEGGSAAVGSPTRRSLLQRITSRSGRGSSKGEAAMASAVASDPPPAPPPPAKWRDAVEGGTTALLSRLFDSPQRQAHRRSLEAAAAAAATTASNSAGATPTAAVMEPLPSAAPATGGTMEPGSASSPAAPGQQRVGETVASAAALGAIAAAAPSGSLNAPTPADVSGCPAQLQGAAVQVEPESVQQKQEQIDFPPAIQASALAAAPPVGALVDPPPEGEAAAAAARPEEPAWHEREEWPLEAEGPGVVQPAVVLSQHQTGSQGSVVAQESGDHRQHQGSTGSRTSEAAGAANLDPLPGALGGQELELLADAEGAPHDLAAVDGRQVDSHDQASSGLVSLLDNDAGMPLVDLEEGTDVPMHEKAQEGDSESSVLDGLQLVGGLKESAAARGGVPQQAWAAGESLI